MSNFNSLFDTLYSKTYFLGESVIDYPRDSLSPVVFQFPDDRLPILQPLIKVQIMEDVETINRVVPVNNYYIIGSILTKTYNKNSDIDVNVEVEEDLDPITKEAVHRLVRRINGRLAPGTTHPINYFIIQGEYDIDKTSAAYDVGNERWLKEGEDVDITVDAYMDNFQNTIENVDLSIASLRRSIIDIDELMELDHSQLKNLGSRLKNKLEEVNADVDFLIKAYQDTAEARREAFSREMSPEEIVKYGKKYKLPENVVYKMLEKYYYTEFIQKLKNILGDEEISTGDVEDLKQAGQQHWNFESYLTEKNKPKRKRPREWKDPLNRHHMKASRGLDRISQKQVSDVHSVRGSKNYYNPKHELKLSGDLMDKVKAEDSGIWRIPKVKAEEIAIYYGVKMPTKYDRAKILGKTKIILWRKKPNHYYLVKDKIHYHQKTPEGD